MSFRERLLAMRQEIDAMIDEVDHRDRDRDSDTHRVAGTAPFLDPDGFGARHKITADTVRRYVKAGMPHQRIGRLIRIDVAQADAWLRDGGATSDAARDARTHARHGA